MLQSTNSQKDDIMRIATLGRDLPDKRVFNISFKSEYSLLDYDVIIFDTSKIFFEYNTGPYYGPHMDHSKYMGYRNLDSGDSVHILEDQERRIKEMIELLDVGKTLMIFCPVPDKCYIDTGQRTYSGTGCSPSSYSRQIGLVEKTDQEQRESSA